MTDTTGNERAGYVPRHGAAPTQVAYPWRATVRTVFEAAVSFAGMWVLIVEVLGVDARIPWVAASLVVTGGVTRVMAMPAVNEWLTKYVPFLAPSGG